MRIPRLEVNSRSGGAREGGRGTCMHELPCDCPCKQTTVLIIRNVDGYDEAGIQRNPPWDWKLCERFYEPGGVQVKSLLLNFFRIILFPYLIIIDKGNL